MAICVRRSETDWWVRHAQRTRRSIPDLESILRPAGRTAQRFPHVRVRMVNGVPEAFVLGTGLAIWEIAWLARSYDGDSKAIAQHTLANRRLIEEGLRYAAERVAEVDGEIVRHTEVPLEELRALLPGLQVVTVDLNGDLPAD